MVTIVLITSFCTYDFPLQLAIANAHIIVNHTEFHPPNIFFLKTVYFLLLRIVFGASFSLLNQTSSAITCFYILVLRYNFNFSREDLIRSTQFWIARWRKKRVSNDYHQECCPVCLETFCVEKQQEHLMQLPCDHVFHVECIIPWIQGQDTCPVCRKKVTYGLR